MAKPPPEVVSGVTPVLKDGDIQVYSDVSHRYVAVYVIDTNALLTTADLKYQAPDVAKVNQTVNLDRQETRPSDTIQRPLPMQQLRPRDDQAADSRNV
jgi:hypothetical protein